MKENVTEARAAVLAAKTLAGELDSKSAIVRSINNLLDQAAAALAHPLRSTPAKGTPASEDEEGTT